MMIHFLRSVLSFPLIYRVFGWILGGVTTRTKLVQQYIQPQEGDRILDIGCGPGDMLAHLSNVEYVGFDSSPEYIKAAQKKYQNKGTFFCQEINTENSKQLYAFDIVIAIGVVHHLNDIKAIELLTIARNALRPGGKLITYDGVYIKGQSPVARYLLSKDRGQYIRDKEKYLELASQIFSEISADIRHDLLRIPYSNLILICTR